MMCAFDYLIIMFIILIILFLLHSIALSLSLYLLSCSSNIFITVDIFDYDDNRTDDGLTKSKKEEKTIAHGDLLNHFYLLCSVDKTNKKICEIMRIILQFNSPFLPLYHLSHTQWSNHLCH